MTLINYSTWKFCKHCDGRGCVSCLWSGGSYMWRIFTTDQRRIADAAAQPALFQLDAQPRAEQDEMWT